MKTASDIINKIIEKEGGWVDHPDDRGGPTNWGITLAVFKEEMGQSKTVEDLKNLTRPQAYDIYMRKYYTKPGFNLILPISALLAGEVTDTGVNMGPVVAARMFQRVLNLFNAQGTRYPDVVVDGTIGSTSITAFTSFLRHRGVEGENVFYNAYNVLQAMRYIELTEQRKQNESFIYGWLFNRVDFK